MAGMTDKDTKEVTSLIKKVSAQIMEQRNAIDEMLKLCSQDKDKKSLSEDMNKDFRAFMKSARAMLDAMK